MAVDKLVDSTQLDADLTSVANAIRTKGGTSAQMAFPAGFVSAVQAIPTGITPTGTKQISITQNGTTTEDVAAYANAEITVNVSEGGGAGATIVASGTAQGSGSHKVEIPIGTKMPIRDFVIALWAEDNTEFTYDSATRQYYGAEIALDGNAGYFGFKRRDPGNGRDVYEAKSAKSYTVNNGGTILTVDYNPLDAVFFGVFGTNKVYETVYQFFMYKYDDHCAFEVNRSNPNFIFPSTVTYNYKVIYYGNDPTNDFLEVS